MLASVNGHKFFLSAEEQERVHSKVENDLRETATNLVDRLDVLIAQRATDEGILRGERDAYQRHVEKLLEDLDTYAQLTFGYSGKPLTRAFDRDECGHRI